MAQSRQEATPTSFSNRGTWYLVPLDQGPRTVMSWSQRIVYSPTHAENQANLPDELLDIAFSPAQPERLDRGPGEV